jgi:hypothetical protein
MELTFSHFSARPELKPVSVVDQMPVHHKPRGLWVSADGEDDWPTWCEAEQFGLERLKYRFRVQLADGWLHLDTPEAIVEFGEEFGVDILADVPDRPWRDGRQCLWVDWARVAQKWPGIVIAPYQWSMRLDMSHSWYYSWDVASGCIWDASIIESVERVE